MGERAPFRAVVVRSGLVPRRRGAARVRARLVAEATQRRRAALRTAARASGVVVVTASGGRSGRSTRDGARGDRRLPRRGGGRAA